MTAPAFTRLSLVCFSLVLSLLTVAEARQILRTERSARCNPLDPATDSIPHPDTDPDCSPKPFPVYTSLCSCTYIVNRATNKCPTNYYVLCNKEKVKKWTAVQSPTVKLVKELIAANDLKPAPKAVIPEKKLQENTTVVRTSSAPEVTEPTEKIQEKTTVVTTSSVPEMTKPIEKKPTVFLPSLGTILDSPVEKLEANTQLLFKPVRPEFADVASLRETRTEPTILAPEPSVSQSPVILPPNAPSDDILEKVKNEEIGRPDQCPSGHFGCIFDDEVDGTDCTISGSKVCQSIGGDYCSAVFGEPLRRVCCRITDVRLRKVNKDSIYVGCPSWNGGCIIGDHIHGANCTKKGGISCLAVGADYCGAVVDGHRVCCSSNKTPPKFRGDGSETCPEQNSGCIFDDLVNGIDCTVGGNSHCAEMGADYCGGWFGFPLKRACCTINRPPPSLSKPNKAKSCPPTNNGCIVGDLISEQDCTEGGSASCNKTGSYCSAYFGKPSKRVCCSVDRRTN